MCRKSFDIKVKQINAKKAEFNYKMLMGTLIKLENESLLENCKKIMLTCFIWPTKPPGGVKI